MLDFYQIDKAKDIINRNILDVQHQLNKAEYSQLTDFEMKLYHTEAVYMIKLPQYAEKISLGCFME